MCMFSLMEDKWIFQRKSRRIANALRLGNDEQVKEMTGGSSGKWKDPSRRNGDACLGSPEMRLLWEKACWETF